MADRKMEYKRPSLRHIYFPVQSNISLPTFLSSITIATLLIPLMGKHNPNNERFFSGARVCVVPAAKETKHLVMSQSWREF
jgi:hypothetical protein